MGHDRGLDELDLAVQEGNIYVPNEHLQVALYDKIDCRIVKFGKRNEITWPAKDGKPANTTLHLPLYLKIYKWYSAEQQDELRDLRGKVITINPRTAWLSEVVALQRKLEEKHNNRLELFKHKVELFRKDRKMTTVDGSYGYIEVKDFGVDPAYDENELDRIVDAPKERDVDRTEETTKKKPETTTNSSTSAIEKINDCDNINDLISTLKKNYDQKNPDKQLVSAYKKRRGEILKENVADSDEPAVTAQDLADKYLERDPKAWQELVDYGKDLANKRASLETSSSDYDAEEDIPF